MNTVRVVDTWWWPDRSGFYTATDSLVDGKGGTSREHAVIGARRCPDGEVTVIVEMGPVSAGLSRLGCSWGLIRLSCGEVRELAAALIELAAADEVAS